MKVTSVKKSDSLGTALGLSAGTLSNPVIFPWHSNSRLAMGISAKLSSKCHYVLSSRELCIVMLEYKNKNDAYKDVPLYVVNIGNNQPNKTMTPSESLKVLNKVSVVKSMGNFGFLAIETLSAKGVRIPQFTTSLTEALSWSNVIGYGLDHSDYYTTDDIGGFCTCSYWMKYKPHKKEYVINVFQDKVLLAEEVFLPNVDFKGNKIDPKDVDYHFRTRVNGFLRRRIPLSDVPFDVLDQAKKAIEAVAFDFGEVKVLWNRKEDAGYVINIDPVPAISSPDIYDIYADAILEASNKFFQEFKA